MSDDRRNPYLVLGVPYGTDRAGATRAFAQRSRRAKRDESFPYTVEDLTWALHQVEANLDDPTVAIDHFRVPADPAPLEPPSGPGLLRPPAVPLERRTEQAPTSSRELLRQHAAAEATAMLIDQAAENGRSAYIPAKPVQPATIEPQGALRRRRHIWPWIIAVVLLVGFAAAVATIILTSGDDAASTSPSTTSTTTTPTTLPATTTTTPPPPTIGDEIAQPTANGGSLTLRPTASVIGYGYLCVVFEVAGTPPLAFAPDLLTLTVPSSDPWPVFSSDPTVSSGAAPTGVVFGDTEPTSREICLPEGGVDQFGGFLTYALDGASYQWALPPSP